jgi:uncharacterized membrane protein
MEVCVSTLNFWLYKGVDTKFNDEDETLVVDKGKRFLTSTEGGSPFDDIKRSEYFLANILSGFFILNIIIIIMLIAIKIILKLCKKSFEVPGIFKDFIRFDLIFSMNYHKFCLLALLQLTNQPEMNIWGWVNVVSSLVFILVAAIYPWIIYIYQENGKIKSFNEKILSMYNGNVLLVAVSFYR